MLDKLNNWFVEQFVFKKQAKNIVKYFAKGYYIGKDEQPGWSDLGIFIRLALGYDEIFNNTFGSPEGFLAECNEKEFLEECFKTVNGTCYLMAVWPDVVYGIQGWRVQKMAEYIDRELIARGFPPQSKEQKERIIDLISNFKFS